MSVTAAMQRRPAEDRAYCADQVRRLDRDRWLTALFAPADRRPDLLALYAFNIEIARARERVSEPLIGRMRLQWWRDTIGEIGAGLPPRGHAVARSLAAVMALRGLSGDALERLVDARERDMSDEPIADMADLLAYAEATSGTLVAVALEALGAATPPARAAGRHVGIAWALVGLVRAVPFHARSRRLYLPGDRLAANGISREAVFEMRGRDGTARVAAEIGDAARRHLDAADGHRRDLPRAAWPALLLAPLARAWLRRLASCRWDPFAPELTAPMPGAAWRMAVARLRGRL